ncbi:MAG TPA: hypothetical protein VMM18_05180 [Gemmatimonadaceae bacterium]|nr:hypothetical protein [Gemmatimonadaceae bacterium]
MSARLDTLRNLVARSPANSAARFGLANELMKAGFNRHGHPDMAAELEERLEEL